MAGLEARAPSIQAGRMGQGQNRSAGAKFRAQAAPGRDGLQARAERSHDQCRGWAGDDRLTVGPVDRQCGGATSVPFVRARWRAALARLPQVAMSHQRRRPVRESS